MDFAVEILNVIENVIDFLKQSCQQVAVTDYLKMQTRKLEIFKYLYSFVDTKMWLLL